MQPPFPVSQPLQVIMSILSHHYNHSLAYFLNSFANLFMNWTSLAKLLSWVKSKFLSPLCMYSNCLLDISSSSYHLLSSETSDINPILTLSWLSCSTSLRKWITQKRTFQAPTTTISHLHWCPSVTVSLDKLFSVLSQGLSFVPDLIPSYFLENIINSLFIPLHHQLLPLSFRSFLSGHKHGKYLCHLKNTILRPHALLISASFLWPRFSKTPQNSHTYCLQFLLLISDPGQLSFHCHHSINASLINGNNGMRLTKSNG